MSKYTHSFKLALSTSVALTSLCGASALAQSSNLTADVITVTAQKREQTLQEVPVSVAVVDAETIREQGFEKLGDLSSYVPSFKLVDGFTSPTINVRGVGTGSANAAFEQSVGTFIDGIYVGKSKQSISTFLDLERVELLRGPQPVFFGQNAVAGALNVTSRRPDYVNGGYISAEAGTEESYALEGAANLALSDSFAVRLAARTQSSDGWLEDSNTGEGFQGNESNVLRISALANPSDKLELFAKYEIVDIEQPRFGLQTVECDATNLLLPCASALADPSINAEFDLNDFTSAGGTYAAPDFLALGSSSIPQYDLSGFPQYFDRTDRAHDGQNAAFQLEYEFDNGVIFTALTGLTEFDRTDWLDLDSTPYAILQANQNQDYEQFSQELRLTSPSGGQLEWMTGLYYQSSEAFNQNFTYGSYLGGPFANLAIIDFTEDASWMTWFGSASWYFSDNWALEGGLRWTNVEKDGSIQQRYSTWTTDVTPGPGVAPTGLSAPTVINPGYGVVSIEDDNVDYQIALRYNPTDTLGLYAKFATGYKAGGFNQGRTVPATLDLFTFEPEEAEAFEIGMKGTTYDGRLTYNLAAFTSEFTNLQTSAFDGVGFNIGNAGAASADGIEIDGQFIATDALTFTYAFALLDAVYDSYAGAQCNNIELYQDLVCDAAGSIDRSGSTIEYATDYSGSFGFQHVSAISDGLELKLNGDVFFSAGYNPSNRFDLRGYQDDYSKINLRAAVADRDGGWEFAVFGRNITDEKTMDVYGPTVLNGTFGATAIIGRGSYYGAQLRVNFGG